MPGQPACQIACVPRRQKREHAPVFEIADDGRIALALAPRPVVDGDHIGRRRRGLGGGTTPDYTEQRVAAAAEPQARGQTLAGTVAEVHGNLVDKPVGPGRPARIAPVDDTGQRLSECSAGARLLAAAKSPDADIHQDKPPMRGQVLDGPLVAAVQPAGKDAASGAGSLRGARMGLDEDILAHDRTPVGREAGRNELRKIRCDGHIS